MGLLILNVPPKVDAWLDEQARLAASNKNDFALKLLKEAATPALAGRASTPEQRLKRFDDWIEKESVSVETPVDDSRDRIYE